MKFVQLENEELANAVATGDAFIQIGNRKFMLFEIEEASQTGNYEVVDSEEKLLLQEAMNNYNPPVSKQEILKRLARIKKQ
ncbi:hypothetical protein FITA111629_11885 [Filibacter tadaridae]|uniref:Uncharacterized protein n=1 Tax=Filibacter tadaridae TaxID=2483811 RepID=A0A3P5WPC5_9BACL|nr:hypothetical protein [Filibacter tadaridae]VDC21100.1 hypothetical protein FILTAD_00574 [Filibacter tadaridae]